MQLKSVVGSYMPLHIPGPGFEARKGHFERGGVHFVLARPLTMTQVVHLPFTNQTCNLHLTGIAFEGLETTVFTGLNCFEVTAHEDSVVNPPVTVQLGISTYIFHDGRVQQGGEHVLIEPGQLIIRDDDGMSYRFLFFCSFFMHNVSVVQWGRGGSNGGEGRLEKFLCQNALLLKSDLQLQWKLPNLDPLGPYMLS